MCIPIVKTIFYWIYQGCIYTCARKYCDASCAAVYVYMYITWKIAVVGFSPHTYNAGVFVEDACSHLIQRLGPIKEVIAQRTRQPDYNALTLSLSHRSLTVGLLYSPWWLCTHPDSGCVHAWPGNGPSLMRRNPEDSNKSSSGWSVSRYIMTVSFRLSLLWCSPGWPGAQSQ